MQVQVLLHVCCLCLFTVRTLGDINWSPEIEQEIVDFVENVMSCRRAPGLSLAIVTKDEILMQRGFGQMDIEQGVPVDENSRLCVASLTKAFTATVMGSVLSEYESTYYNGWDTTLREIFGFAFNLDHYHRSELTTIRDLLAHKTGLAPYYDFWKSGLDPQRRREDYIYRFQFLTAVEGFRTKFIYNDWMYFLASCVLENITGVSYEDLVRQRIFQPLEMTNSIFIESITDWNQIAKSYFLNETSDAIQEMDPELLRTITPGEATAGICSTATDMAKWLQFQLRDNKLPVIPNNYWEETHLGQFFDRPMNYHEPQYPITDDTSVYGLGWRAGTYRGQRISQHGGQWIGFESNLVVYHDLDLAIFAATNGPLYEDIINDVITYHVADLVLGKPTWLNDTTACTFPEPWDQSKSQGKPKAPISSRGTQGSKEYMEADHDKYVGEYGHLLFGNFTVYFDEDSQSLRFSVGRLGQGQLIIEQLSEWCDVVYDGPLSYYHWTGGASYPKIYFSDLQPTLNGTEQYQELQAHMFDEQAPPIFTRGIEWDDFIVGSTITVTAKVWTIAVALSIVLLFDL